MGVVASLIQSELIDLACEGTDDLVVYPRYVMILGIKEAKAQVDLLAELMALLSQEDLVAKLEAAQSPEAIVDLLSH